MEYFNIERREILLYNVVATLIWVCIIPDALDKFYLKMSVTENYTNDHDSWIALTKELLSTLPSSHYRLLGYLTIYLSRYEAQHGRSAGVCGVFAPVILPHVPPATTLLRDILAEALVLFPDW